MIFKGVKKTTRKTHDMLKDDGVKGPSMFPNVAPIDQRSFGHFSCVELFFDFFRMDRAGHVNMAETNQPTPGTATLQRTKV